MNKWLSSLIAILTVTGLQAQQPGEPPRLVVNIVVDQLRGDYLQAFSSTFGEKGFKRLIQEGLYCHQVDFGFSCLNEASAIATIHTGTYPYYHGITGNHRFDAEKLREVSIVADDAYMGNYTTERYSPLALMASTIGDELKVATDGRADVYSIAPDVYEAIVSAGRYANAAFWLDNHNGQWATTTYYKDLPRFVDRFNASEAIGTSGEREWKQSYSHYIGSVYSKSQAATPFKYTFTRSDQDRYIKVKESALINSEITSLAERVIENGAYGVREYPNMLSLTYYAGNYKWSVVPDDYSYEIQDIYYRLDRDLERLFSTIDKKVGMKNAMIVLTSTGYYDSPVALPAQYKPMGEFYPQRCTALLNMYLMATYGQGNWVLGYYNQQLFLNRKLIEEKQLNQREVIMQAAEFVAQFSGVQDVTTLGQWLVDDSGRAAHFRRGMHKKTSGDLFLELQPGWRIVMENITDAQPLPYHRSAVISPLFILSETIKTEQVFKKIKATEIAPTIAYALRIRPPTGAKDAPLMEYIKR